MGVKIMKKQNNLSILLVIIGTIAASITFAGEGDVNLENLTDLQKQQADLTTKQDENSAQIKDAQHAQELLDKLQEEEDKAKEQHIKDVLNANDMNYISHDKIPEFGCYKKRPDFIFDFIIFYVILYLYFQIFF